MAKLSDIELVAIQSWVDGEFDMDSEDTARHWVGRLLTEKAQLLMALELASECIDDAAFPKQSEIIRCALTGEI